MMKRLISVTAIALLAIIALAATGHLHLPQPLAALLTSEPDAAEKTTEPPLPTITVVLPVTQRLEQKVLVTGTLVARREILIAPEIEGQRIVGLLAEEGDRVTKDQPLAQLDKDVLLSKRAENTAALARAEAAIAQAQSTIAEAEARRDEAKASLERAAPLLKSRVIPQATFDQRQATARTTEAQLVAARDGLQVAKADKKQIEAQRTELEWRLAKTTIVAPVAGVISRRNAKIGSVATGVANAQPMFHLIEDGAIELDADVPEAEVGLLRAGQTAALTLPDGSAHTGTVRLVSPEIDQATRLGSIRIALRDDETLRVGGFARGTVTTAAIDARVVPISAVAFTPGGAMVKTIIDGKVVARRVETGIQSDGRIEILSGLSATAEVVLKAGSFLRDGDAVRSVRSDDQRLTEAR